MTGQLFYNEYQTLIVTRFWPLEIFEYRLFIKSCKMEAQAKKRRKTRNEMVHDDDYEENQASI